jgi:hypothetical protein
MKEQEQKISAAKKIDDHIKDMTDFFMESIPDLGAPPVVMFLYDENGEAYAIPINDMEIVVDKYKSHFRTIIKSYIKQLKDTQGVTIIHTALFQGVYYKSMEATEGVTELSEPLSEDADSKEGFLITRETKDKININMYDMIYSDDRTKVTISEKPIETFQHKKKDNNQEDNTLQSVFVNIL